MQSQPSNPTRAKPTSNRVVIQVEEAANEENSDQEDAKNAQRWLKRVHVLEFLEELRAGHRDI